MNIEEAAGNGASRCVKPQIVGYTGCDTCQVTLAQAHGFWITCGAGCGDKGGKVWVYALFVTDCTALPKFLCRWNSWPKTYHFVITVRRDVITGPQIFHLITLDQVKQTGQIGSGVQKQRNKTCTKCADIADDGAAVLLADDRHDATIKRQEEIVSNLE